MVQRVSDPSSGVAHPMFFPAGRLDPAEPVDLCTVSDLSAGSGLHRPKRARAQRVYFSKSGNPVRRSARAKGSRCRAEIVKKSDRRPATALDIRRPRLQHTAAIETAASRDTDREPSPFAQGVCREAERRRFADADRRVIVGDGAPWIWALADECFPDAIQIVDIFHAKSHLWDVAKAICTPGSDLAAQWAKQRRDELDAGRISAIVAALPTTPQLATRPANASTISSATASACAIPRSGPAACASPPASSRLAANMPSGLASSAPECTGPSTAPMPSSPCAAASSADASKPSGNDETPLHETAPHKSDVHPTSVPCRWCTCRAAGRSTPSPPGRGGRGRPIYIY